MPHVQSRMKLRKPRIEFPKVLEEKMHPCGLCHRTSSCLGYVCGDCGFRVGVMQLFQFYPEPFEKFPMGTKRCRCGNRKWLYPCETNQIRRAE